MKIIITIVFIVATFLFGCGSPYLSINQTNEKQLEDQILAFQKEEPVGSEITLLMKDRHVINGELLSVRDSKITLCTEYSAKENELANLQYPIHAISTHRISELTLEGDNYTLIGVGAGAAVGTIAGILLAENYESEKVDARFESCMGTMSGICLGSAIIGLGALIGSMASTDDVILYDIPPGYKFVPLKSLARYKDTEPDYLRAIE